MRGTEWDEAERRNWSPRAVLVHAGVGVAVGAVVVAALAWVVFGWPPTPTDPPGPPAGFGATVDPGSGGFGTGDETVTVVHEGGERLDPGTLDLRIDTDGNPAESRVVDGVDWPSSDDEDGWGTGESATHTGEIPRNATVVLVWTSASNDSAQILEAWDVEAVAADDVTATSDATPSVGATPSPTRPVHFHPGLRTFLGRHAFRGV